MKVLETIHNEIMPLRASDSVKDAREAMHSYGVTSLPVVDHTTRKMIGAITTEDIEQGHPEDTSVYSIRRLQPITVHSDSHVFEAARIMIEHQLHLLPVVDRHSTYIGILTRKDLFEDLVPMLNVTEYGAVICVEMEQQDFTLSDMVRLIESEDAKILSMTVEMPDEERPLFRVSMKLNVRDLSRIRSSLRRYEIQVTHESIDDSVDQDYENRADEFIRYLNV